jgi:hypothetical protein
MSLKRALAKPLAQLAARKIYSDAANANAIQHKLLSKLLRQASNTVYGRQFGFSSIRNYAQFRERVPLIEYENLSPYIARIKQGEQHVLWKGQPLYFAKTSGTTSGTKYIPISKASISNHIHSARNALFCYIAETGNSSFLDGNMIFLSGSPALESVSGIKTGRLSGIVNHHVPAYLRPNQLPTYETNCIEDWEQKVNRIVEETRNRNMTLISGIPPWVQMYFDRLLEVTGKKTVKEVFPAFSLFAFGGVNYAPYRQGLEKAIGQSIDSLETYPASEGFIAYQDSQQHEGLLLNVNSGIFFEFVPAAEISSANPRRFSIDEVETGVNYAIIITNNAGLWAYNLGDTVKFVSLQPPRIVVTGRVKHFISAFGEHVISEEVERAAAAAAQATGSVIAEFHVAPLVSSSPGHSRHQWFVEFSLAPDDAEKFRGTLESEMLRQNSYYRDLIEGKILRPLELVALEKDSFTRYMKSLGKLGGQNKVPRLANDRTTADSLMNFAASSS